MDHRQTSQRPPYREENRSLFDAEIRTPGPSRVDLDDP